MLKWQKDEAFCFVLLSFILFCHLKGKDQSTLLKKSIVRCSRG